MLVDRGWIPFDYENDKFYHNQKQATINGVLAPGIEGDKYSRENNISEGKWYSLNAHEIATVLSLPNKNVSGNFIIKQIELDPSKKGLLPKTLNIDEVDNWPIRASTNGTYEKLWLGITFFNMFTNMFVWIYL